MSDSGDNEKTVRLDQWLHAVRLFKTRALAASAVKAHRVELNGRYAKPSRPVAVGDTLKVRRGEERFELTVTGLTRRRVSAKLAVELYAETEASRLAREADSDLRRMAWKTTPRPPRRPGKRDRRRIIRFVRDGVRRATDSDDDAGG